MPDLGLIQRAPGEFRLEEHHPRPGTVVLGLHGEADLRFAADLRDAIGDAIEAKASSVVVDLSQVTFIDSMALGILLGGLKRLRTRGGQLRLVTPPSEIRRIFEITLLDKVFPIDASTDEAFAAIAASHDGFPG